MRTWRRIAGGVALGLGGLLLNLAAVEALPGVHFLLGPVAVLLAAVLLGPVAGGVAGAISGWVTLGLWGHPWGWLNLTLEGLFVGRLSRRLMPITADALYWLLSPLYFALTYYLLAGIPAEAVMVAEVVRRVSEPLVSASPSHTLRLELSPVEGLFDELRIEQVLQNLVSNAIKYSPSGGPIDVQVKRLSPSEVELSVADRGIGLGGENKEQLFERFERGERKALKGIYGLGVGLYVSREIVRLHGGRISLHNREGGGTVAAVVLPLGG